MVNLRKRNEIKRTLPFQEMQWQPSQKYSQISRKPVSKKKLNAKVKAAKSQVTSKVRSLGNSRAAAPLQALPPRRLIAQQAR